MSSGWEDRAAGWIAWARTPGHDDYWLVRDAFFELLPTSGGTALEIGCGEGRVCRDLRDLGWSVTGTDASPTLIAAAVAADRESNYAVADAAALPFTNGSFDLVVAYNSLMDVGDMPASVAEAARTLRPGGRLCACVTHPFKEAGAFASREDGAPFVVEGSYFDEGSYEVAAERDGLAFAFASRTFTLASYARALEEAGLLLEALREPAGRDDRDTRVPQFLLWRARKL